MVTRRSPTHKRDTPMRKKQMKKQIAELEASRQQWVNRCRGIANDYQAEINRLTSELDKYEDTRFAWLNK